LLIDPQLGALNVINSFGNISVALLNVEGARKWNLPLPSAHPNQLIQSMSNVLFMLCDFTVQNIIA